MLYRPILCDTIKIEIRKEENGMKRSVKKGIAVMLTLVLGVLAGVSQTPLLHVQAEETGGNESQNPAVPDPNPHLVYGDPDLPDEDAFVLLILGDGFTADQQQTFFDEAQKTTSLSDLQLVSWILGNFQTIDEVKQALSEIHVVAIDPRASTVHWRIADSSGRQVVLEIVGGKLCFYENKLGVLTNSPGFEWQMTNLNNYVNLYSGGAEVKSLGDVMLKPFGAGSGFLGIPGDVTPPSRFVRAAFYQTSAPQQENGKDAVLQSFQILNNFDIPVGIEFKSGEALPADIPSATQWTSSTDIQNRVIYYRTMYNSAIRCIDLKTIDFSKVNYQAVPLDKEKQQPVETIVI